MDHIIWSGLNGWVQTGTVWIRGRYWSSDPAFMEQGYKRFSTALRFCKCSIKKLRPSLLKMFECFICFKTEIAFEQSEITQKYSRFTTIHGFHGLFRAWMTQIWWSPDTNIRYTHTVTVDTMSGPRPYWKLWNSLQVRVDNLGTLELDITINSSSTDCRV